MQSEQINFPCKYNNVTKSHTAYTDRHIIGKLQLLTYNNHEVNPKFSKTLVTFHNFKDPKSNLFNKFRIFINFTLF